MALFLGMDKDGYQILYLRENQADSGNHETLMSDIIDKEIAKNTNSKLSLRAPFMPVLSLVFIQQIWLHYCAFNSNDYHIIPYDLCQPSVLIAACNHFVSY